MHFGNNVIIFNTKLKPTVKQFKFCTKNVNITKIRIYLKLNVNFLWQNVFV